MFGGLGGLDPKKMQAMMKQLGMHQEEISALRVVIEKEDGNRVIIDNPSVSKISIQGQESFQISGDSREEENSGNISDEDVKTIIEKTGVTEKKARKALEDSEGDLADAILSLKQ